MRIRVKYGDEYILCDVNDKKCKGKNCFQIGKYTHRSPAGYSGCSSWTEKNYSCIRRDNWGCPLSESKITYRNQEPDNVIFFNKEFEEIIKNK